jgi:hypothetical protein
LDVEDACHASIYNRNALLEANDVSCYSCQRVYRVTQITRWTDRGTTAICPYCGIDAVIPGQIPMQELQAMYAHWFAATGKGRKYELP